MDDQEPDETCWVCGKAAVEKLGFGGDKPTCREHCGSSANGSHAARPNSVAVADDGIEEHGIAFDIWCTHCGQSGAFFVEVVTPPDGEIQWG